LTASHYLVILPIDSAGEPFFAAERGKAPYNQMGLASKEEHLDYGWKTNLFDGGTAGKWDSGVILKSETDGKAWKVSLALPLDKILPGGAKPGRKLYANFYRSTPAPGEYMAWSPDFDKNCHLLSRMGALSLE